MCVSVLLFMNEMKWQQIMNGMLSMWVTVIGGVLVWPLLDHETAHLHQYSITLSLQKRIRTNIMLSKACSHCFITVYITKPHLILRWSLKILNSAYRDRCFQCYCLEKHNDMFNGAKSQTRCGHHSPSSLLLFQEHVFHCETLNCPTLNTPEAFSLMSPFLRVAVQYQWISGWRGGLRRSLSHLIPLSILDIRQLACIFRPWLWAHSVDYGSIFSLGRTLSLYLWSELHSVSATDAAYSQFSDDDGKRIKLSTKVLKDSPVRDTSCGPFIVVKNFKALNQVVLLCRSPTHLCVSVTTWSIKMV